MCQAVMRLKTVVFPAPLGPMMAVIFPCFDFEAEIVDGAEIAERLRDMPQLKKAHEDLLFRPIVESMTVFADFPRSALSSSKEKPFCS